MTDHPKPITLLDVVRHQVGEKESYTGDDFEVCGLPMFGGCGPCGASIAGYNAYPSRCGFLRCASCIGPGGFYTVKEFLDYCEEERRDQSDADAQ